MTPSKVVQHPSSSDGAREPEFDFASRTNELAEQLKRERGYKLRALLQRYELAQQARESLQQQMTRAHKEVEAARGAIRDFMGQGEVMVVGDTIVERHENGGLNIRPCHVVKLA